MTNAEIIKALEYCINSGDVCDNCPLFRKKESSRDCVGEILREALALICRQQAELEKLRKEKERTAGMKKPELCETGKLNSYYVCPSCGTRINIFAKRCYNCGQELNWIDQLRP